MNNFMNYNYICQQSTEVQSMRGLFGALAGLNLIAAISFLISRLRSKKPSSSSTVFAGMIPLTLALSCLVYALSAYTILCGVFNASLPEISTAQFTAIMIFYWIICFLYNYSKPLNYEKSVRWFIVSVSCVTAVCLILLAIISSIVVNFQEIVTLQIFAYLTIISAALLLFSNLCFMILFIVHRGRNASPGPLRTISNWGIACTSVLFIAEILFVIQAAVIMNVFGGYLLLFFRMLVLSLLAGMILYAENSALLKGATVPAGNVVNPA